MYYARHEPTNDEFALKNYSAKQLKTLRCHDVCIYNDEACTDFVGRYPYHLTKSKPSKRRKTLNLNYRQDKLTWLPTLVVE